MNFSDVLDQLMPLFQKKLELSIEKEKAIQNGTFLTPEQKDAIRKTDLEYNKLEHQVTNDKDKLKLEMDKAVLGFKNGLDLQTLQNQGHVDVQKIASSGQENVAKITAEAAKYGHDVQAQAHILAAALTASKDQTNYDPATGNKTGHSPGSKVGLKLVEDYAQRTGLSQAQAIPTERSVDHDATYIRGLNNADPTGKSAAAAYKNLAPERQKEVDAVLGVPSATPVAAAVAAGNPATTAVTPAAKVAPVYDPATGIDLNSIKPWREPVPSAPEPYEANPAVVGLSRQDYEPITRNLLEGPHPTAESIAKIANMFPGKNLGTATGQAAPPATPTATSIPRVQTPLAAAPFVPVPVKKRTLDQVILDERQP